MSYQPIKEAIFLKKINKLLCLSVFIVTILCFFEITADSILTVQDDVLTYMQVQRGDLWQTALSDAKHGRICHILTTFLLYVPYLFNSGAVVRILSMAAIIFDLSAFYLLVRNNIGKCEAYLSCLLFISFACISNQHNLFVAYIIGHQISIGLVLFSLSSFLSFYKCHKNSKLIVSAALLFAAASLYETMAVYILLFAVISMYKCSGNIFENCFKIIYGLRFHLVFLLTYLVIYISWQTIYPCDYDGAKLYFGNIPQSIYTILVYSVGMIPGLPLAAMLVKHDTSISDIIGMADIKLLIIPVISAIAFYFVFPKLRAAKKPGFLIILCIIGMIIPNLLLGFTSKYTSWTGQHSYSYLTSFYSYFFMIPLFIILLQLIYSNSKSKKPVVIIMTIFVFIISLCASVGNVLWNKRFGEQLIKYKAFSEAVSDPYFDNIEDGATIYIPDYNGIHNDMSITKSFAMIYTDSDITFENDRSKLDFDGTVICLRYDSNSGAVLIGRIDSQFICTDVYVPEKEKHGISVTVPYNMENMSVAS